MISVPGVGSGLDVSSIVSQLVAVEGNTKTLLLANKQEDTRSEITAFGTLKSLLSTFQSSTTALKLPATFDASLATSSDDKIFTASTTGSVAAGVFDVEVRDLAESHKLLSAGFTDADTVIGEGILTISVGTSDFAINIDSSNSTVTGVRDAINDATDNTGVSATIITVDDGAGGTLTKLVLTSENTGTDNALTITVNDTDDGNHTDASGLSALYYDTGDATTPEQMTQINAATDAEVYIDGQKVLSDSNTVVDAIQGVTLNLVAEDVGTDYTLTIAEDKARVTASVELFVSNYNSFISLTNNFTSYNVDTGSAGIFLGDATLRTLRNQVRSEISNSVDDIGGPYAMLVDIGITTKIDGTLSIDSSKLADALNTNFDDVGNLFSSTNGIAVKLDSVLTEYTKADGIIDSKTKGLNTTIARIAKDFEALDRKLDALEERLLAQFSGLDVLLTQLNSTSNFLTEQFKIIGNIFDQK
jgi:flagellar hook-associated protein 2